MSIKKPEIFKNNYVFKKYYNNNNNNTKKENAIQHELFKQHRRTPPESHSDTIYNQLLLSLLLKTKNQSINHRFVKLLIHVNDGNT